MDHYGHSHLSKKYFLLIDSNGWCIMKWKAREWAALKEESNQTGMAWKVKEMF